MELKIDTPEQNKVLQVLVDEFLEYLTYVLTSPASDLDFDGVAATVESLKMTAMLKERLTNLQPVQAYLQDMSERGDDTAKNLLAEYWKG